MTPEVVVVSALVGLLLLYLATLSRLRFEAGESPLPPLPTATERAFFLNAVLTAFPVAIAAGLVIGTAALLFLPGRRFPMPMQFFVADYELLGQALGVGLLYIVSRRSPKRIVLLMLAIGFALGLASSIVLLSEKEHLVAYTYAGITATLLAFSLLFSTQAFAAFVAKLRDSLEPNKPVDPK